METRVFRPYFDLAASGRKMRMIRKERNISVEQVRRYMGFESVQAIYKWERGECLPQADTLIALSLLYQVNPIELLEEDAQASSFPLWPIGFRMSLFGRKAMWHGFRRGWRGAMQKNTCGSWSFER